MASAETKSNDSQRSQLAGSIGGAVVLAAGLAIFGRILPVLWVSIPLALAAAAAVWFRRAELGRRLTSLPFAVAILFVILTCVILGTFVAQNPRHSHGLAGTLGLDRLFDSFAFRGLLATLALSLALIAARRRASWGLRLAHLGVIAILLGGLAGNAWGTKGRIDLREGATVRAFVDEEGRTVELGFDLRLDRFEVERYPTEYRLYVYRQSREGFEALASHPVEAGRMWTAIDGSAHSFRVKAVYPDFRVENELRDDPDGSPALRFHEGTLFAGDVLVSDQGRTVHRFVWDLDETKLPVATAPVPERHEIALAEQTIEVKTGATYRIGAVDVGILEFLPDFAYDRNEKRAYSRSALPENPALRVSVANQEKWLFATRPGDGIVYRYHPPQEPAERELLYVGRTREILEFHLGVLANRRPFRGEEVRERAVEHAYAASAGAEWRNPVVEIETDDGETGFLPEGEPVAFDDRVLVLERKPDIKSYRSRVTAGSEPAVIEVNEPLVRNGFHLYQANYKPEDPTYSGLQVVKDPGLYGVYAGFGLVCLGLVHLFYLRRRWA